MFITTNSTLAFASRKFEKKEYNNNRGLPTCLTDIFLGTLIWLHSPAELININEKKIIADCYASLTPSDKLIAKYIEEVEKLMKDDLITKDNYYLLRSHRSAINILETKTYGNPNEFTTQTVQEILDSLIEELKKEEREKLEEEKLLHTITQEELELERDKLEKAETDLADLKEREKKRKENIEHKIDKTSNTKAIRFVKNVIILLVLLLCASFIVQAINYWLESLPKILTFGCWGIIGISSLFNLLLKFNIIDTRQAIYNKSYNYFRNKELDKFGSFI